jgi:hypothetical protein
VNLLPSSSPTGTPRLAALAFVAVAASSLLACGSTAASPGNDGGTPPTDAGREASDAPVGPAEDAPLVKYPAFPVDYPQVLKNQGTILESPVIVTISWSNDPSASTWETFGDGIGASTFWTTAAGQYGVGKATSGPANHVRMTVPLPATLGYEALLSLITNALQAGSDAGAPTDGGVNPPWPPLVLDASGNVQTIYSLFIPPSTAVTDPGTGLSFCDEGASGYHAEIDIDGHAIPYAVNLNCPPASVDAVEETASHEYVEAATNPYVNSNGGYIGFDPNHLAWDLYTAFADELADACQNWQDSYFQETGSFPYWVQSVWSNTGALAGHDPCVPSPAGPYHGMTLFPSQESMVDVNLATIGGMAATSRGFNVTVGTPLTFQVGYFSDGDTGGPWPISYIFPSTTQLFDTMGNPVTNGKATVSIDKTSGQNGDKANVTVTVTEKGEAGFHVMAITWDPPANPMLYQPHYIAVLLVDQ